MTTTSPGTAAPAAKRAAVPAPTPAEFRIVCRGSRWCVQERGHHSWGTVYSHLDLDNAMRERDRLELDDEIDRVAATVKTKADAHRALLSLVCGARS